MPDVILTKLERQRMEATHQIYGGGNIIPALGAEPVAVCGGCGMVWPCPGRRLLEAPTRSRWQRLLEVFS